MSGLVAADEFAATVRDDRQRGTLLEADHNFAVKQLRAAPSAL
jgi:hypothetical protein